MIIRKVFEIMCACVCVCMCVCLLGEGVGGLGEELMSVMKAVQA